MNLSAPIDFSFSTRAPNSYILMYPARGILLVSERITCLKTSMEVSLRGFQHIFTLHTVRTASDLDNARVQFIHTMDGRLMGSN